MRRIIHSTANVQNHRGMVGSVGEGLADLNSIVSPSDPWQEPYRF